MAHLALQRPVTKRKTDSNLRSVLMALNELYFLFLFISFGLSKGFDSACDFLLPLVAQAEKIAETPQ